MPLHLPKYASIQNPRLLILYNVLMITCAGALFIRFYVSNSFLAEIDLSPHIRVNMWVSGLDESRDDWADLNQSDLCASSENYDYWYSSKFTYEVKGCIRVCGEDLGNFTSVSTCLPVSGMYDRQDGELFFHTMRGDKGRDEAHGVFEDSLKWVPYARDMRFDMTYTYDFEMPLFDASSVFSPSVSETRRSTTVSFGPEDKILTVVVNHDRKMVRIEKPQQSLSFTVQELFDLAGESDYLLRQSENNDPNQKPGGLPQPIGQMTGAHIEVRLFCSDLAHLRIQDQFELDEIHRVVAESEHQYDSICELTSFMFGGWVVREKFSTYTAATYLHTTTSGIRISTSVSGGFTYIDPDLLLFNLTSAITIMGLPKLFVMFVTCRLLGHISSIYKKVVYEKFRIGDQMVGMVSRLMTATICLKELEDKSLDGKGAISREKFSEWLKLALKSVAEDYGYEFDEMEKARFVQHALNELSGVGEKVQESGILASMADFMEFIPMPSIFSSGEDSVKKKKTDPLCVKNGHYLVAVTSKENIDINEAVKLFDEERPRSFLERLFTPSYFLQAITQKLPDDSWHFPGGFEDYSKNIDSRQSVHAIARPKPPHSAGDLASDDSGTDKPGLYMVTRNAKVTSDPNSTSLVCDVVPAGSTVEVVEVVHQTTQARGRITAPDGWITLRRFDTGERLAATTTVGSIVHGTESRLSMLETSLGVYAGSLITMEDGDGCYVLTCTADVTNCADEKDPTCEVVGQVPAGTRVEVTEVKRLQYSANDKRDRLIRALIQSPKGWITVCSLETGARFAYMTKDQGNDECRIVKVGDDGMTYYCSHYFRQPGIQGDGCCGPHSGPQCKSCKRYQAKGGHADSFVKRTESRLKEMEINLDAVQHSVSSSKLSIGTSLEVTPRHRSKRDEQGDGVDDMFSGVLMPDDVKALVETSMEQQCGALLQKMQKQFEELRQRIGNEVAKELEAHKVNVEKDIDLKLRALPLAFKESHESEHRQRDQSVSSLEERLDSMETTIVQAIEKRIADVLKDLPEAMGKYRDDFSGHAYAAPLKPTTDYIEPEPEQKHFDLEPKRQFDKPPPSALPMRNPYAPYGGLHAMKLPSMPSESLPSARDRQQLRTPQRAPRWDEEDDSDASWFSTCVSPRKIGSSWQDGFAECVDPRSRRLSLMSSSPSPGMCWEQSRQTLAAQRLSEANTGTVPSTATPSTNEGARKTLASDVVERESNEWEAPAESSLRAVSLPMQMSCLTSRRPSSVPASGRMCI